MKKKKTTMIMIMTMILTEMRWIGGGDGDAASTVEAPPWIQWRRRMVLLWSSSSSISIHTDETEREREKDR